MAVESSKAVNEGPILPLSRSVTALVGGVGQSYVRIVAMFGSSQDSPLKPVS